MAIEDGRYLCCPMCQGKGQLQRSELIEQLSGPERDRKFRALLDKLAQQAKEAEAAPVGAASGKGDTPGAFEQEVHSWPPKRILWRRSPKE